MSRAPNILFIMSDDHASHAMSCYGSRINRTPNLDRIAAGGMRFDNCFCTNSICTPSRAAILTGTYNHVNGVTTLATMMDNRLQTFPKLLQAAGYQTAHVGKWHLGQGPAHWPTGFDYWTVFPGQGRYHDPEMVEMTQPGVVPGYATDIVTDHSLRWLRQRNRSRPFLLMCHHKAPHRPWDPHPRHAHRYADEEIPYPETFDDDYAHRAHAAAAAKMRIERDFVAGDVKVAPPDPGRPRRRLGAGAAPLTPVGGAPVNFAGPSERKRWLYQRYIKDYLAASTRSTRVSGGCSTTSTTTGSRTTPSSSTPPTRASFSATTAGTTSGSCTRSRCACRSSCATRAPCSRARSTAT